MNHLISVEAATKKYGEIIAVDDLSLSVAAGEIYGLIGTNGAGKSTLIRLMTGLAIPDRGTVTICGENVARAPRVKKRLGYLPEELFLYERLSGREFLQLVAGLKEADPATIDAEMEFFELSAAADKWIGGYSLGMRKKVGLAAAMIGSPAVLILDEPLNGLDVRMMRQIRLRLEAESERGRAVLVSSHVMDFVERVCHRVGVIKAGRLVAEGTTGELRDRAQLPTGSFEDVFFHLIR